MTPANDNISLDEPLRLAEACRLAFPHGGMTVSGLRREATRGRLVIERIANKDFTTLRALQEMRALCRVDVCLPASGFGQPKMIAPRRGSSSTVAANEALDAARSITRALKER